MFSPSHLQSVPDYCSANGSVEIGSLSISSPNESQFFGSSSGVFFVNTVLRAFAEVTPGTPSAETTTQVTGAKSPNAVPVESCIAEPSNDSDMRPAPTPVEQSYNFAIENPKTYGISENGLGRPPAPEVAQRLVMSYFEHWHPILPFLHGPTFLQEMEAFYASDAVNYQNDILPQARDHKTRAVTFQCILNIANMDMTENVSLVESTSALMSLLGQISMKHDVPSLQALLAAQLYLIASMSLQAASTVGGMLWRNIFHAGFHRCPVRYVQLSDHDCEIRKRILWSTYAMDRYLSQALGHPLGIQDPDIDVCVPGARELNRPVPKPINSRELQDSEKAMLLHLPEGHPGLNQQDSLNQRTTSQSEAISQSATSYSDTCQDQYRSLKTKQPRHSGEDVLAAYIGYSRITGHVLELFHKSIHNRSVNNDSILILTSEVHAWWNNLPQKLQDLPIDDKQEGSIYSFAPFFTVIYQQLILLINRPSLSLNPTRPAFKSSLQICIGASRSIISTLKIHYKNRPHHSAPGILSSTWMAGLVIAFACQLNAYPSQKGLVEIQTCMDLLQIMGKKWNSAKHCHKVLELLRSNLVSQLDNGASGRRPNQSRSGSQILSRGGGTCQSSRPDDMEEGRGSSKRQRQDNEEFGTTDSVSNSGIHSQENSWHSRNLPIFGDVLGTSAITEMERLNEAEMPDLFGQVSWESLFHTNGDNMPGMATFSQ